MIREFLASLSRTRKSELEAYWMDLNRSGVPGAPSLEEARKDFFKSLDEIASRAI